MTNQSKEFEVSQLSIQSLAFMGDAVYEQFIREQVVNKHHAKAALLHKEKVQYVKASYQAEAANRILPKLNEREMNILMRGRNSDPGAMPKHANPSEYRWATALEALIGYLYLSKQETRLQDILLWIYEEGTIDDKIS